MAYLEITCNLPSSPTNGQVVTTSLTHGSKAFYSCDLGYEHVGVLIRVCQFTGLWSESRPTCRGQILFYTQTYDDINQTYLLVLCYKTMIEIPYSITQPWYRAKLVSKFSSHVLPPCKYSFMILVCVNQNI